VKDPLPKLSLASCRGLILPKAFGRGTTGRDDNSFLENYAFGESSLRGMAPLPQTKEKQQKKSYSGKSKALWERWKKSDDKVWRGDPAMETKGGGGEVTEKKRLKRNQNPSGNQGETQHHHKSAKRSVGVSIVLQKSKNSESGRQTG